MSPRRSHHQGRSVQQSKQQRDLRTPPMPLANRIRLTSLQIHTQQLHDRLRDVPELIGVPRDNGIVWRLTRRRVVMDYWPSTGTAAVLSFGLYKDEVRYHLTGNQAVKWLKKMSRKRDDPAEDGDTCT